MRGERKIAVVVRQARDEVMIGQQAWFGHEIHGNDIIRVGAANVPDLVGRACVGFPRIAGQTAIRIFEEFALLIEQFIVTAIAVEEINARSAEQQIIVQAAERAVDSGIFELVKPATIICVEIAVNVHEQAEGLCRQLQAGNRRLDHERVGGRTTAGGGEERSRRESAERCVYVGHEVSAAGVSKCRNPRHHELNRRSPSKAQRERGIAIQLAVRGQRSQPP